MNLVIRYLMAAKNRIPGLESYDHNFNTRVLYNADIVLLDFIDTHGHLNFYVVKASSKAQIFAKGAFIDEHKVLSSINAGKSIYETYNVVSICYEDLLPHQFKDERKIIEKFKGGR